MEPDDEVTNYDDGESYDAADEVADDETKEDE